MVFIHSSAKSGSLTSSLLTDQDGLMRENLSSTTAVGTACSAIDV